MREDLGDGYAETLRAAYPEVPESADFVMYWWHKAAELTRESRTRRFGFITTNSIRQTFNRRVVKAALDGGISLAFAIPDHPWVDTVDGAAVRIAMTVGAPKARPSPNVGACSQAIPKPSAKPASKIASKRAPTSAPQPGRLHAVTAETPDEDSGEHSVQLSLDLGTISADLGLGATVASMKPLQSNEGLTSMGVMLAGSGFILTADEAKSLAAKEPKAVGVVLRQYRSGRDLTDTPRNAQVIDFCSLSETDARTRFPRCFEAVLTRVKPERDQNRDEQFRTKWWLFGRVRPELRALLEMQPRYIATTETSKHRFFQFLPSAILLDHSSIGFGLSDAFHLGVLSSRIHGVYALAAGGTLEDRPRYNKTRCFDPFPFPECTETQMGKIRKLAEELDAHRKRAQQQHGLGLTDIYNVLEKLRQVGRGVPAEPSASPAHPEGSPYLSTKEQAIHDAALVSTLKHLHDELDAAVAAAYGWSWPLADEEILERVVALNAARANEEAQGTIRWLRSEYQKARLEAKGERREEEQPELGLTQSDALDSKSSSRKSARGRAKSDPSAALRPPSSAVRRSSVAAKRPWPKPLAERAQAVEAALAAEPKPVTAAELATRFARAKPEDIAEILDTLAALGRARRGDAKGTFLR
jgi:hypothetical protein